MGPHFICSDQANVEPTNSQKNVYLPIVSSGTSAVTSAGPSSFKELRCLTHQANIKLYSMHHSTTKQRAMVGECEFDALYARG